MVDTRSSSKPKAKSTAPRQRTLFEFSKRATQVSDTSVQSQAPEDELKPPISIASTSTRVDEVDKEGIDMAPVVEQFRQASLEPRPPIHPFFLTQTPKPTYTPLSPAPEILEPSIEPIIEITDSESPIETTTYSNLIPPPETGGSQEDPIVLNSSPLKPLLQQKSNESKPLAPIFALRRPKAPPVPSTSRSPEVEFLELSSQPTKTKKSAPWIAPRQSIIPSVPTSSRSKAQEVSCPFPDKESQHVRGPQHTFSAPGPPYGRVHRNSSSSSQRLSHEPDTFKQLLSKPTTSIAPTDFTPSDPLTYLDTIPEEYRHHPAITRFATTSQVETSTHRLWVDKWRPTCAKEVLGNEENAIYLRDWIHALELQLQASESESAIDPKGKGKATGDTTRGTKRPRVVRTVEKKRGRKKRRVDSDDDDNWIVYSGDDFSSVAASSPPPYDAPSSPPRSSPPLVPIIEPAPQLGSSRYTFNSLTNTMLLVGPSGSGKTAAVYACAEELGWDVLEVYPGIGRRNGVGVDSLIGDAGKNHHVRTMRKAGTSGAFEVLKSMLKESKDDRTPILNSDEEPASKNSGLAPNLQPPSIRQSLILLEEVDILFKEDTNFWPAVTNFIKDCRRPVICTCNDISLVPVQDLPLQTTLFFQPCPPSLAVSYLQALCSSEGHIMFGRDTLLRMYEESEPNIGAIDMPDISNPAVSSDFPAPDLRRTINRLQFLCTSASGNELVSRWEFGEQDTIDKMCDWNGFWAHTPRRDCAAVSADQGLYSTVMRAEVPPRDFILAARHADAVSFADTYLIREPWETQEGLAWSACEPSNDDEVGYGVLYCPRALKPWFGAGLHYTHDSEMASMTMWLARGPGRAGVTGQPTSVHIIPCRTRELFRARVHHQSVIGRGLDGIVPVSVMALRRKEVRLDYMSKLREIMVIEDGWEAVFNQAERPGRLTKNSRGSYQRIYEITEEGRAVLCGTLGQT